MSDPRINLPVSKLEDEIERLQTRNERLALLVRLMTIGKIELYPDWVDEGDTEDEDVPAPYIWICGEEQIDCTYTNGIPDLTDEQWERLAKLERGEA